MKHILIIALLFSSCLFSQEKIKNDIAISPEVILQKDVYGGLNVLIGDVIVNKMVVAVTGVRLGVESNFQSGDDFIIAPKVGYEASILILTARLSAITYFQNGHSEFRILPEIGISLGGFINLTYGYNFRITNSQIPSLNSNRFCLSINLNKKLMNEVL